MVEVCKARTAVLADDRASVGVAPIPAVREADIEPPESTQSGLHGSPRPANLVVVSSA
jgi:hypothetical protein